MADFAAITATLQRMGLKNVEHSHHELRFEFPVLDLLDSDDDDAIPYLPYPEDAGFRDKPASSRAHLGDSGTGFFLRMPLRDSEGSDGGFSPFELPGLFMTIGQLSATRGHSLLQIAASEGRHSPPTFFFRLTIEREDMRRSTIDCKLSSAEFEQVQASCQSADRMEMMLGLINRSSNRAYFHVHQRLRHYTWYQRQTEQHEMQMKWDQEELEEAKQLLAANLTHIRHNRSGLELRKRIRDLEVEEDVEGVFMLPRGDLQIVNVATTRSMSSWLCKNYQCKACDAFVLQPEDFANLRASEDRQRRAEIAEQETHWEQLAESFSDGCKQMRVYGSNLASAAQHALKSLEVPESVSPQILEFAQSPEADGIMKAIWVEAAKREIFEGTQDEIGSTLLNIKDKALAVMVGASEDVGAMQILPPGWEKMSQRWLMRAFQLVSVPGYDGRNIRAVFDAAGERHEEKMERQATVDEIEGLMAQASIL